ncbi:MAG: ABC transporter substrate-binding protein [Chloroflexi bacterium]|nr:ABC transporter substrate-binding protein [Chloroflexota bacterium]
MPAPTSFTPHTVISLVPSVTESLFDLQLGNRLIGITDYCVHPADQVAQLPRLGGTKNPDVQRIIAMQPDLVIMNTEENRREDADALQNAGVTVWATGPQTVAEAINLLWEIMDVFDEAAMVPRVRHIEQVFDYTALAAKNMPSLRVFVPIWRDPWMTFNAQTYTHDLLSNLGAVNVFAERERRFPLKAEYGDITPLVDDDPRVAGRDTRYPRVSLAEIEAAQPEVVLLPNEPYQFTEKDAAEFYQLDIPAAQHGTIYLIDGSLLTWHGTRLSLALTELPPMLDEFRARLADKGKD